MVQWLFLFCLTCVWSVPDIVPDTVPDTVDCKKVKICDQNKICAIVCERGTVVTNVWQRAVLHFQRQATYLNTICNLQLPGTHNSGINIADVGDYVIVLFFNQVSRGMVSKIIILKSCCIGYRIRLLIVLLRTIRYLYISLIDVL